MLFCRLSRRDSEGGLVEVMASRLILALLALLSSCNGVNGALAWGTFLGADWATGEGEE
jgi:hypothetical protein